MLFFKADDSVSPLMKIHAHGKAENDMGTDLIATSDPIDTTLFIQNAHIWYDGVKREAYLIVRPTGEGLVVLQGDREALQYAMKWR